MIKKIKIFAGFTVLICLAGLFVYWRAVSVPADLSGGDELFTIKFGEGVNQISANLKEAELINSMFFFETYVWLHNYGEKLKAGEYVLSPMLTIEEIAKIFVEGRTKNNEITVTIPEGWGLEKIGQYFEEKEILAKEDFLEVTGTPKIKQDLKVLVNFADKYDFLQDKPAEYSLEGFLFPDTYRIHKGTSAIDVVDKLLSNFDSKLSEQMRSDIEAQGKTVYEIVIMASLIEKEVRKEDDMKIVSGLFWNRLDIGQPLQSDATLSYLLDDDIPAHTLDDLKVDSPFNSYKFKGLPPTPIGNPGIASIRAAIYPADTDYYYFLNDPKTGKTIFSKTYAEHLQNKNIYLK